MFHPVIHIKYIRVKKVKGFIKGVYDERGPQTFIQASRVQERMQRRLALEYGGSTVVLDRSHEKSN